MRTLGIILVLLGIASALLRRGETDVPSAVTALSVEGASKDERALDLVRIDDARLDWQRRVHAGFSDTGGVSFARHSFAGVPVSDTADCLARAAHLRGGRVRLAAMPAPAGGRVFLYRSVAVPPPGAPSGGASVAGDVQTELYAPLEGTGGRLWAVSLPVVKPDEPRAKAFVAATSITGRLVPLADVIGDPRLAQAYQEAAGAPLPEGAFAIVDDGGGEGWTPVREEIWAPCESGEPRDAVWIAFPLSGPEPASAPPPPYEGVLQKLGATDLMRFSAFLEESRAGWRAPIVHVLHHGATRATWAASKGSRGMKADFGLMAVGLVLVWLGRPRKAE